MSVSKVFNPVVGMDASVKQDCVKKLHILHDKLQCFHKLTAELAKRLDKIAEVFNKAYSDVQKATAAGSVAGIVGGVCTAVGLGLSFFTFGFSLPLAAIGAGVGALGGITAGGAVIGEYFRRNDCGKKAEDALKEFEEQRNYIMQDCHELVKLLGEENLDKEFGTCAKFIMHLMYGTAEVAWSVALKALESVVISVRVGKTISEVGVAVAMGRGGVAAAMRAGGNAAKVLHGVGSVLGIILIPVDAFFLYKAAKNIKNDEIPALSKLISKKAEELRNVCPSKNDIHKFYQETLFDLK